jgi:hypothetical protein
LTDEKSDFQSIGIFKAICRDAQQEALTLKLLA